MEGQQKTEDSGAQQEGGAIGGSAYSAEFYLFSFKIVPCTATYAHNWSLCPFVHPNEKARRRDPRHVSYEPLPCPFDKKGANCPYGDACTYTHNVYEYWLHPKRFRTQMCQQGAACKRPLCFFAHNLQELRFADAQSDYLRGPQDSPATAAAAAAAVAGGGSGPPLPGGQPDAAQQQRHQQLQPAGAHPGMYIPAMPMQPGQQAPAAALAVRPMVPGMSGVAGMVPAGGAGGGFSSPLPPPSPMQPMQQQWLPGYMSPQGYVLLSSPQAQMMPGPPLMYFSAMPGLGGADVDDVRQQQVYAQLPPQQQHYQPLPQQHYQAQQQHYQQQGGGGLTASPGSQAWVQPVSAGTVAAAAAAAAAGSGNLPLGPGVGMPLQYDPAAAAAISPRPFQAISEEQQVLLSHAGASTGLLQQHVQSQEGVGVAGPGAATASDAGLSGSAYSWSLPPLPGANTPGTTSASISLSQLSLPTGAGLSTSTSVPGSSNSSLSHTRPGQAGAATAAGVTALDALQARMQHMTLRNGSSHHVRDL